MSNNVKRELKVIAMVVGPLLIIIAIWFMINYWKIHRFTPLPAHTVDITLIQYPVNRLKPEVQSIWGTSADRILNGIKEAKRNIVDPRRPVGCDKSGASRDAYDIIIHYRDKKGFFSERIFYYSPLDCKEFLNERDHTVFIAKSFPDLSKYFDH